MCLPVGSAGITSKSVKRVCVCVPLIDRLHDRNPTPTLAKVDSAHHMQHSHAHQACRSSQPSSSDSSRALAAARASAEVFRLSSAAALRLESRGNDTRNVTI